MATGELKIEIDDDLRNKLSSLAKKRGETEAETVRAAVEKLAEMEQPESCYDLLMRIGGIGVMKDGPPDLSTNPKYLEGLGRD